MSLNKFTHISVLKNDVQLKQKSANNYTKKKIYIYIYHPNLLKNKNHVQNNIYIYIYKYIYKKKGNLLPKRGKKKKKSSNVLLLL